MLIGIDHIVLATEDPDTTAADLETRLGLIATGGGRHEGLGTFNRLVWLGDSYLELISVDDPGLAREGWLGQSVLDALDRGGGLVTWAIAVDDLDEALRWAPPDGGLVGPLDGERRRPDGDVVRWRLARAESVSATEPFLIEHDLTAAEWRADERTARGEERHPIGGRVRLAGLEVVTASPAAAAGRLRTLLAAPVEAAGRGVVRVRLGAQEVRFVAARPGSPAVVELIADVPMRTRTVRIGDCDIRLRGLAIGPGASSHPEGSPAV